MGAYGRLPAQAPRGAERDRGDLHHLRPVDPQLWRRRRADAGDAGGGGVWAHRRDVADPGRLHRSGRRDLPRGQHLAGWRRRVRPGHRRERPGGHHRRRAAATADSARARRRDRQAEQVPRLRSRSSRPPTRTRRPPPTVATTPPRPSSTATIDEAAADAADSAKAFGFKVCGDPSKTGDSSSASSSTTTDSASTTDSGGTVSPTTTRSHRRRRRPRRSPPRRPTAAAPTPAPRRRPTAARAPTVQAPAASARSGAATRPPTPPSCRRARRSGRRPSISSSCVPDSTIRPCSRTTIRPARRMVESRWAITIAVRPASSRSSPCSITRSVRTSMFEVASSRIRIRGSGEQGARECDELPLAGREMGAALADLGVESALAAAR